MELGNLGLLDALLVLAVLVLTVNDVRLARHLSTAKEAERTATNHQVDMLQRNVSYACEQHDRDYARLRLEVAVPDQDSYIKLRRELVCKLHHDTTTNQELLRDLVNLAAYGRSKGWEC